MPCIIESHFTRALKVFEELVKREKGNRYVVENDIWRARILNNFGLLYSRRKDARNAIKFFRRSIEIKTRHNERQGVSRTLSNIANLQLKYGDLDHAAQTLNELVEIMGDLPDKYICEDTISQTLEILQITVKLPIKEKSLDPMEKPSPWVLNDDRPLDSALEEILRSLLRLMDILKRIGLSFGK